jgi:hypothetical protein
MTNNVIVAQSQDGFVLVYDLPTDKQDAVYREATDGWADAMTSQADYLNDRKGEHYDYMA